MESKHERGNGETWTSLVLGDISLSMGETDAKMLSHLITLHKVLKDEQMAVVIGDFQIPWITANATIIRWLLVGVRNAAGDYQLAIMHELYSEYW